MSFIHLRNKKRSRRVGAISLMCSRSSPPRKKVLFMCAGVLEGSFGRCD